MTGGPFEREPFFFSKGTKCIPEGLVGAFTGQARNHRYPNTHSHRSIHDTIQFKLAPLLGFLGLGRGRPRHHDHDDGRIRFRFATDTRHHFWGCFLLFDAKFPTPPPPTRSI